MLCVHYYSKWIEISKLDNLGSLNVINYLQSHFSRYGIPDQLVSDNGPQFISSEFSEFAKNYGFTHITSSPHYPQANGEAERAVQTVKHLFNKAKDPYKAMLDYRNTPLEEINLSPAQLMMGRRLKTILPTTAPLLKPQVSDEYKRILTKQKKKQKQYYDVHSGKELPPLQPDEMIHMKIEDRWIPAKVLYKHDSPRSYVVQSKEGRKYRRNRRDIRSTKHVHTKGPGAINDKTRTVRKSLEHVQSSQEVKDSKPEDSSIVRTKSGRVSKPPEYLLRVFEYSYITMNKNCEQC